VSEHHLPTAHITAHDPHYRTEPDILDKGLRHNSLGLLASVALAVSTVAPVYSLTVALGPMAQQVGAHLPAAIIGGFVPMLLVAFAYRALNLVIPDAGTAFTWTVKAFGPATGWMCGWALIAASVIVLSNTAGVAATFFWLFVARLMDQPELAEIGASKLGNVLTTTVFVAMATWVAWRGMMTTKRVTYALVVVQMLALLVFCWMAFTRIAGGEVPTAIPFDWSYLNPFAVSSAPALISALGLSTFMYWGWDVSLCANEETRGSERTPALAALASIVAIAGTYLLVALATQMFAGLGETGIGLGNPENNDNVFASIGPSVMGHPLDLLLFGAVLACTASSLQTTFLQPARTVLAMSVYRAVPALFAEIHPRHRVPGNATLIAGVLTAGFYAVMTWVSESVLSDTIASLSMMVCVYYALTAFACVWYFRHEYRLGWRPLVTKGVLPLAGGLALTAMFLQICISSYDPDYGSGGALFGVGTVFVIGVGILVLGAALMLAWRLHTPDFFRGQTLRHDTPALIVEEPVG